MRIGAFSVGEIQMTGISQMKILLKFSTEDPLEMAIKELASGRIDLAVVYAYEAEIGPIWRRDIGSPFSGNR